MAQKDRKSGIQNFECNVDTYEKNTLHFWEIYESFTTMNDARASPEHTKFVMDVRWPNPCLLYHLCAQAVTSISIGVEIIQLVSVQECNKMC